MIYAHQGGWDEILMVLAPVALLCWLLHVANKRAELRRQGGAEPESSGVESEADRADG